MPRQAAYPTPDHEVAAEAILDRLYNAYREFLQPLLITRRAHPTAYKKRFCEQVGGIPGLPELDALLTHLFEIRHVGIDE